MRGGSVEEEVTARAEITRRDSGGATWRGGATHGGSGEVAIATRAENAGVRGVEERLNHVREAGPRGRKHGGRLFGSGVGGIVVAQPAVQREIGGGRGVGIEGVRGDRMPNGFGEGGRIEREVAEGAFAGRSCFRCVADPGGGAALELGEGEFFRRKSGERGGRGGGRRCVQVHDGPRQRRERASGRRTAKIFGRESVSFEGECAAGC